RRKIPWGLPTGWLKRGEQAKAAIVREIHEESGLRAEVEGVLTVESALPYGRVDLVFRCRIVGGEFRPSPEVSQACYFPVDDLPPLLPEQEAAIALALAGDPRDVPKT
ncbi:MAG: NUDIX domain-containing protein, partial [Deltaproteobacteria bacterium]